MKVRIMQPEYSLNPEDADICFEKMLKLMESCNEPLDLIVMPEWADIPAAQKGKENYLKCINKYNETYMQAARDMAKRCNAVTFVNCGYKSKNGWRNTTHALDRNGNTVGRYYKAHPAPKEDKSASVGGLEMDSSYTTLRENPYTVEIEGVRYGFMTCYDFYMYEAFAPLALQKVDVIIGCSHQRTDTHSALSIINKFLAYHTNAYVVRSSVSLGEDSPIGGGSCIIAPNGDTIADMKSRAGYETHEIDVNEKYYKAAGFRGDPKPHYAYIEEGRRPWLYRNGGRSVSLFDRDLPYPRICAHRGFNTVAPENSMPAWGAAIALGAQEIEFDLWTTKDGVLVSCHDKKLERVSNGTGLVTEHTYEELLKLDFGLGFDGKFAGLKIPSFEDILEKFASRVIMNIHVKIWDARMEDDKLEEIVALVRKYDCAKHVYFTTLNDEVLKKCKAYAPDIAVCVAAGKQELQIVDRAIEIGAEKVQLVKRLYNADMVKKAHEHGIRCNFFWSDDIEEAKMLMDMGVDTLLTNDYQTIATALNI